MTDLISIGSSTSRILFSMSLSCFLLSLAWTVSWARSSSSSGLSRVTVMVSSCSSRPMVVMLKLIRATLDTVSRENLGTFNLVVR